MAGAAVLGRYAGNGVDGRAFTGLGFRPQTVFIWHEASSFGLFYIRNLSVTGLTSHDTAGGSSTHYIQSIDADGFTVGAVAGLSANQNGQNFTWMACRDDVYADHMYGSYVGNGLATQSVTSGSFTPAVIFVWANLIPFYIWRTQHAAGFAYNYAFGGAGVGNAILGAALGAFSVGPTLNVNGTTYYYSTWREAPGFCTTNKYTGNGIDNRNISHNLGANVYPDWLMLDARQITSGQSGMLHVSPYAVGDSTFNFRAAATGTFADWVQSISINGFQVGQTGANFNNEVYDFVSFAGKPYVPSGAGAPTPYTSINKGSPRYPNISTGTPGAYEFHKSIRKGMRQLNNLVLGD